MYGNVAVLGVSTSAGTTGVALAATGANTGALLALAVSALILGLALTLRSARIRRAVETTPTNQ